MRCTSVLATSFLAIISSSQATFVHKYDNGCSNGASEINGNWYCSTSVQAITFTGFQQSGNYSRVTGMDNNKCSQGSQAFDSPLGSIGTGNDLSWHFKGPLQLNQFAHYALGSLSHKKRDLEPEIRRNQHGHSQFHHKKRTLEIEKRHVVEFEKRAVCDIVSATFAGVIASWTNLWDGSTNLPASVCDKTTSKTTVSATGHATTTQASSSSSQSSSVPEVTSTVVVDETTTITYTVYLASTSTSTVHRSRTSDSSNSSSTTASTSSRLSSEASLSTSSDDHSTTTAAGTSPETFSQAMSSSLQLFSTTTTVSSASTSVQATSSASAGSDVFIRAAYYNATAQTNDGLVFLNNMGGQGSGVWDSTFGNSLSYASCDAKTGSANPEVFDGYLDDGVELAIFSNTSCDDGDSSCGFTRPGTVAHLAFDNSEALFLLDFSMPITNKQGYNMDMPAIWALNAQIPRTLQYGNSECSCWESGCGEFDLFEVLDSGNEKMKATWHGLTDNSGGSSYWFQRPQKSQKAGVLFSENSAAVTIFYLPDNVDFGLSIDEETVEGWINTAASDGSLFTLTT